MKLILFGVFQFLLIFCYGSSLKDAIFSRYQICDIETRIENECTSMISNVRSLLECLAHCNHQDSCVGASITTTQSMVCYIHQTCDEVSRCRSEAADHEYYSKNCQNGGAWIPETRVCKCVDGWVGASCNALPKSCEELKTNGYAMQTVHKAMLDLSEKSLPNVQVLCSLGSPASSIVLMNNNGVTDVFLNDWESYLAGFAYGAGQNWLGLEKWHILSKAGYTTLDLKIYFTDGSLNICETDWYYHGFTLQDETKNFAFTIDSATNSTKHCENIEYRIGDCLGGLQNVAFSTLDKDNDDKGESNCAQVMGSGWWYSECDGPCNVLGMKQSAPNEQLLSFVGYDMDVMRNKFFSSQMSLQSPSS